MTENTKIEWADHTFNPWVGCQKVGPGCDNCYAEGWAKRSGLVQWGPGAERRVTTDATWAKPRKWNAQAEASGTRARVFCASLADVFDNAVPPFFRKLLWSLIKDTPHLDWLLLTKRPGNIADMLPPDWGPVGWPNVWLGCTVVNQAEADRDIPKLLAVPARVHFLSMEPLLGLVDITAWLHDSHCTTFPGTCICGEPREEHIDWVIVGGESGPKARPMHPDWARSIRDQCQAAGVPFFFKQWGEWHNGDGFGEDLDGCAFGCFNDAGTGSTRALKALRIRDARSCSVSAKPVAVACWTVASGTNFRGPCDVARSLDLCVSDPRPDPGS